MGKKSKLNQTQDKTIILNDLSEVFKLLDYLGLYLVVNTSENKNNFQVLYQSCSRSNALKYACEGSDNSIVLDVSDGEVISQERREDGILLRFTDVKSNCEKRSILYQPTYYKYQQDPA